MEKMMNDTFKDERVLFLTDNIDQDSVIPIVKIIIAYNIIDDKERRRLNTYERKPIKLYISSYGGNVSSCFDLVSTMMNSSTPIHTYCMSNARSAGLAIFMAGDKRFISKYAHVMYHQISNKLIGSMNEINAGLDFDKKNQAFIDELLTSRSKITQKKLDDVNSKKENLYIFGEEAVKLGIATDLIRFK